jgi:hypothetical protein
MWETYPAHTRLAFIDHLMLDAEISSYFPRYGVCDPFWLDSFWVDVLITAVSI